MSVLSTGQPLIQIAVLDKFDNIGEWRTIDVPKDGTTSLETAEGDKTEYLQEGGGKVDVEKKESGYTFVFDLYVKKDWEKPIQDRNGVIVDNYAVRLAPKDRETKGFVMYKAQVACISTYSVADGMICRYQFEGLQTDDHENIWDYWVEAQHLYTDKNFVDIDATAAEGETITATVTATITTGETLTATPDTADTWLSATVSSGTATITAEANSTGKRREGWVTMSAGGRSVRIRVNQPAASAA